MELITKNSPVAKNFFSAIDNMLKVVENTLEQNKPVLNGERFLTGDEVCDIMHISKRTLKEYRDAGKLSFISLPGKVLYKESDIQNFLEENYYEKFEEYD